MKKFGRTFLFFLFLSIFPVPTCIASDSSPGECITLWHQWTAEKREILSSAMRDFNCAGKDAKVVDIVAGSAGGVVAEQIAMSAVTERPHLALVEREALPLLAAGGRIIPVDGLLEDSGILARRNWTPSAIELVQYRGRLYGIPAALNPYVLIYNPALLSKTGASLPSRWDDFLGIEKNMAAHSQARGKIWALNTRSIDSLFSILCTQNGITSPASQQKELAEVLHFIARLREQKVLPPHYKFWDPLFSQVTDGDVVFQIEDAGVLAAMKDSGIPLGVAPLPSASNTRNALSDSQVFVLCRQDRQDTVREFLEFFFLSSQYGQLREKFFFVSPFAAAEKRTQPRGEHDLYPKVVAAAENAQGLAFFSRGGNEHSEIARVVARLDAGLLSAEQALKEIVRISGTAVSRNDRPPESVSVGWAENTRRIFANRGASLRGLPVSVTCGWNEHECFQLVLLADKKIKAVTWKVEPLVNDDGSERSWPVMVHKQKDTAVATPLVSGEPGLYPNVLEPVDSFDLNPGESARFWVDIFVPKGVAAGSYNVSMALSDGMDFSLSVPIALTVVPMALPSSPSQPAVIGLNYDLIARHYNVNRDSKAGRNISDAFYWFLVERRLTPYQPPVPLDSVELEKYLPEASACRIPLPASDKSYESIVKLAEKNGWLEKYFVYFIDEPTYHQYQAVVEAGKKIHARERHPKYLVTCFPDESLVGSVDIWCIFLSFVPVGIPHSFLDRREYLESVRRRQAAGDDVWWYTAGAIKPFPTLHIEDDPAAFRIIPWMQQLYGIRGFLHWEAANWTQPPEEPFIPFFGNGEGVLVYPGDKKPLSSIRLELLREGFEDMEYLFLLRRKIQEVQRDLHAQKLGDVASTRIKEICRRLVLPEALAIDPAGIGPLRSFCREPGAIERVRLETIDEIMNMTKRPYALVLTDPEEKRYTESDTVEMYGVIEPGGAIAINGRHIAADAEGFFRASFLLTEGVNTFSVHLSKGTRSKILTRTIEKF